MRQQVDLLVEGEINHASVRRLDRAGYRLHVPQQVIHQMCKSHSPVLALRSTLASCLEEVTSTVRGRVVCCSREALYELDIQEGLLTVL